MKKQVAGQKRRQISSIGNAPAGIVSSSHSVTNEKQSETSVDITREFERSQCVVVGVGASSGGLDAFMELLRPLPQNPGMAFVVIPHLDPKHESAMTQPLARATQMQVRQVHEGMKVKPDCVYVIPQNQVMTIESGTLHLVQRERESGPNMPIDAFLRSLATDCGKNAIGIILSGTATDGTFGVAAIKHEGGITFAQEPRTAKYAGMPEGAIASGHIDFVLSPAGIARELMRLRNHPYVNGGVLIEKAVIETGSDIEQVFRLLKQVRGVDFSDYKMGTIRRRILRRMALAHIETLSDYVKTLKQNPKELEALHHDILINVTSFFRDPTAFEVLGEVVYPRMLQGRHAADTIRIWVPGCSTGEEAYSHAISLLEHVSNVRAEVSIQIFGTDLSEEAVRVARAGIYRDAIASDISPARLRRFFTKVDRGYQISKAVRDMCVFATQNVFNDPPFSHMDLVSCRNVLIYMSPVLQRRVFPIFHYALKPTGFLMVGNTEGIVGTGAELFEPADKRHKIYMKKMVTSPVAFGIPASRLDQPGSAVNNPAGSANDTEPVRTPVELQRDADRLLLSKYVPAAVVVNEQYDIVQVRGKANRYLELPSGKATLNLLKMAKSGLLFELQKALEETRSTAAPVRRENVQYEVNGHFSTVNMEVIPIQGAIQSQQSYVVVFEAGAASAPEPAPAVPENAKDRQIAQLKQELAGTKDYLQSIIEALQASNEELQSANEEIQSGNEELQSTNGELQTSKEELESANEELNTVNEEMQHRNAELSQVNNDLSNLLASVNISILMLDSGLNIRRMMPRVEELMGITPADLGRPISQLAVKSKVENLEEVMRQVIEDLQPRELEVEDSRNRKFWLRITPYRTMDNRIEGVVLAFVEALGAKGPSKSGASKSGAGRTAKKK